MEDKETLRKALLSKVVEWHGDQRRKYDDTPYWLHPLAVADMVDHIHPHAWEIALCHDVLEDTPCDSEELYNTLYDIGYSKFVSDFVTGGVVHLTDVYEKKNFPDKNRKERKALERVRLSNIPSLIQSIKYADLIHNTQSIVADDKDFAKVYLKEINDTLAVMRDGDWDLFRKICFLVQEGLNELSSDHSLKIW